MDRETLIAKVKAAGVVGAGGAGFPTHVKLEGEVDTVIVNGAECEPLLAVDVGLLESQAELLVVALEQLVKILGAKAGVIAIKAKHQTAINNLQKAIAGRASLSLKLLRDVYPVGDEQVLIYEVLRRTVPEGGIPLNIRSVVVNVETLLNIAAACADQPVVTTYVTITGEVRQPLTLGAPVGTPMVSLLDLAQGTTISDYQVIEGGPMTGKLLPGEAVKTGKATVKKTTKGLIVLSENHWLTRQASLGLGSILQRAQSACCQCRLCTDLCPRHLLGHNINPHLVLNAVNHGQVNNPEAYTQSFLCSDCGVCELYACPAGLSPRRMYQAIKAELISHGQKNPHRKLAVPRAFWAGRQIPASKLISRLGLAKYNQAAPLTKVAFSPRQVVVPLKQHIGVQAIPKVQVGDMVKVGQVIASPPQDVLGALVHASIAGRVREIDKEAIIIAGE